MLNPAAPAWSCDNGFSRRGPCAKQLRARCRVGCHCWRSRRRPARCSNRSDRWSNRWRPSVPSALAQLLLAAGPMLVSFPQREVSSRITPVLPLTNSTERCRTPSNEPFIADVLEAIDTASRSSWCSARSRCVEPWIRSQSIRRSMQQKIFQPRSSDPFRHCRDRSENPPAAYTHLPVVANRQGGPKMPPSALFAGPCGINFGNTGSSSSPIRLSPV